MAEHGVIPMAEVLNAGIHRVPDYQRNYAWETPQLRDLAEDLQGLDSSARSEHFFGTLIVKDLGNTTNVGKSYRTFEVIDGQQRLTTVSILLYCIYERLAALEDELAKRTASNMLKEYLIDPDTGTHRLILNGGDQAFYHDVVLRSADEEMVGRRAETESERRLLGAKQYMRRVVATMEQADLTKLMDKVLSRLSAVRYVVRSDAEAGLIFEVTNDRGRALAQLDKVKNYLMYLAYKGDDQELAELINARWASILKNTSAIDASREDTLLKYHWIARTGQYRESDIHRALKSTLHLGVERLLEKVSEYVDSLSEASFVLRELDAPEQAFEDCPADIATVLRVRVAAIHRWGVTATFMPLLLASRIAFRARPDLLLEVVNACECFSFRAYKLKNHRADYDQYLFHSWATKLLQLRKAPDAQIEKTCREAVAAIYSDIRFDCDDDEVRRMLAQETNILWKLENYEVKHLLYELEVSRCQTAREAPADWSAIVAKGTIEHIWPQHPKNYDDWPDSAKEVHRRNVGRIGNLTLTFWNPELSNRDFSEKRRKYLESNLRIQRELADSKRWKARQITNRSEQIGEFAVARWVLPRNAP